MSRHATVDLVFFSGCPHTPAARTNLEAALGRAGRPTHWQEWDLEDPATPSWAAGYASPTILVEGRDVSGEGPSAEPGVLSCRSGGAPSVEQIVSALSERPAGQDAAP